VNGKLDNVNGTFSTDKVTKMKCKYNDEVQLCLGCGVVMLANERGEAPFGDNGKPIHEGQ
jgi:hypothetical protein